MIHQKETLTFLLIGAASLCSHFATAGTCTKPIHDHYYTATGALKTICAYPATSGSVKWGPNVSQNTQGNLAGDTMVMEVVPRGTHYILCATPGNGNLASGIQIALGNLPLLPYSDSSTLTKITNGGNTYATKFAASALDPTQENYAYNYSTLAGECQGEPTQSGNWTPIREAECEIEIKLYDVINGNPVELTAIDLSSGQPTGPLICSRDDPNTPAVNECDNIGYDPETKEFTYQDGSDKFYCAHVGVL